MHYWKSKFNYKQYILWKKNSKKIKFRHQLTHEDLICRYANQNKCCSFAHIRISFSKSLTWVSLRHCFMRINSKKIIMKLVLLYIVLNGSLYWRRKIKLRIWNKRWREKNRIKTLQIKFKINEENESISEKTNEGKRL